MNDFTKEELEELKRCCNWVINCKDTHYTTITYGLPEKIQSMIDNYCEHEWRKGVHLFNDVYCTKCSKHFEVNNEK